MDELRRSPADMEHIPWNLEGSYTTYGSQQLCSFHVLTHFFAWILWIRVMKQKKWFHDTVGYSNLCFWGVRSPRGANSLARGDRIWKLDIVLRKDWINIPSWPFWEFGAKSRIEEVWFPAHDPTRFSPLSVLSYPVAWEWRWGGGEWEWIPLLATKDIPDPNFITNGPPPQPVSDVPKKTPFLSISDDPFDVYN